MEGDIIPYIEYWKSIVVVELKFDSLEKHLQLHGNLTWSNPIAQGHYHYFTGKFLRLHIPIDLQKPQNFSTLVYHNVNIPPSLFAYVVIFI